tara:strand:+ start:150 stop:356 length:207 start_codon:yes stop_codon:yes gene_type:complete
MELFLRPLENTNDPVWSVIVSIIILLIGVGYYIYTIMSMAFQELEDAQSNRIEGRPTGSGDSTSETPH